MSEFRLLERISKWEQGVDHLSAHTQTEWLIESVIDYLKRILNTRQGSVPINADFGVPDFTNVIGGFSAGSTQDVERQIQRMVMRYEPRIRSPRVHLSSNADDTLSLHFTLDATIQVDDREIPLHLSTVVNGSGRVNVHAQGVGSGGYMHQSV